MCYYYYQGKILLNEITVARVMFKKTLSILSEEAMYVFSLVLNVNAYSSVPNQNVKVLRMKMRSKSFGIYAFRNIFQACDSRQTYIH